MAAEGKLGEFPTAAELGVTRWQYFLTWGVHSWAAVWAYRRTVAGERLLPRVLCFLGAFFLVPFSLGLLLSGWKLLAWAREGASAAGAGLAGYALAVWQLRRVVTQRDASLLPRVVKIVLWHLLLTLAIYYLGAFSRQQLATKRASGVLDAPFQISRERVISSLE